MRDLIDGFLRKTNVLVTDTQSHQNCRGCFVLVRLASDMHTAAYSCSGNRYDHYNRLSTPSAVLKARLWNLVNSLLLY